MSSLIHFFSTWQRNYARLFAERMRIMWAVRRLIAEEEKSINNSAFSCTHLAAKKKKKIKSRLLTRDGHFIQGTKSIFYSAVMKI
jgi:hypothetical protein